MRTLFSQESVWEIERYNIRQESILEGRQEGILKGRQEGILEGRQQGIETGIAALVGELQKFVNDQAMIARSLVSRFGLSQETAAEKVQQYWKS